MTSAVSGQIEIEHLHRYFLARQLCRGRDVIDVASGEGYGSALLAQTASSVTGIEIDQKAVDHANVNYRNSNLRYLHGDARKLPISDSCADVVVSFETIEHVGDQISFLQEVKRVLRPGGFFVVSSPNRDVYSPANSAANPFHVCELTPDEFADTLAGHFANVRLLFQRPLVGSALIYRDLSKSACEWMTFERRGNSHFEASNSVPRSPYVVAIGSDGDLPLAPASIYIHTDEVGTTLSHASAYQSLIDEVDRQSKRAEAAELELAELRGSNGNLNTVVAELHARLAEAADHAVAATAGMEVRLREACEVNAEIEAELQVTRHRLSQGELALSELSAAHRNSDEIIAGLRGELVAAGERAGASVAQLHIDLEKACAKNSNIEEELRLARKKLAALEHLERNLALARRREMMLSGGLRRLAADILHERRRRIVEVERVRDDLSTDLHHELKKIRGERDLLQADKARQIANDLSLRFQVRQAESRAKKAELLAQKAERIAVEWRMLYDLVVKQVREPIYKWMPKGLQRKVLLEKR
ncbi:class I SAM-dependent methyltransferase [Methylobacterium iners]|nr:class I SAM-dependent methyltransferase [Methylobacterium iners]